MKRRTRPKQTDPMTALLEVMARLRSPTGCPWDREQDHFSLRMHAVEEVYELIDAIEAEDDREMLEELGDLLLQVVFHCQLARERGAFDFGQVCQAIVDKLVRRHPHVFGDADARTVDAVWTQWEQIKRAEKQGRPNERPSALDGIPRHLPALQRAEKLIKKARKAGLMDEDTKPGSGPRTPAALGRVLFGLAQEAQRRGWHPETLLRAEIRRQEKRFRGRESKKSKRQGRR